MERLGLLTAPRERTRSNGIDVLRGFFSIYVLIFAHLTFWTLAAQGPKSIPSFLVVISRSLLWLFQSRSELNPAVIGFIVLSGFCIHRNGLRLEQNTDLGSFTIRRVYRILPVFWLGCLFGVLMFMASSQVSPQLAQALTGTTKIEASCILLKATTVASIGPFDFPCEYLGNAPLLTVMVDIGLYAFYAISFVFGREVLVLTACALSVLAGFVISALGDNTLYNWWQNSSLLAFLPYWWIGAAICVPEIKARILKHSIHIGAIWLALTISTLFIDPTPISAEVRKLVLALLMGLLILRIDAVPVPSNPLSEIGKASYSIYAFHAPLAAYLCTVGLPLWLNLSTLIGFGFIVYLCYERPLDRVGHSLSKLRQSSLSARTDN